jgi:MinD-like ATPase involved in chromosome partitioning or flagellar assembly
METGYGKVVTFYSYKGGVGRSMALANIAVILAKWGKKVLMVDWDLEAPGLEYFFYHRTKDKARIWEVQKKKGVIDILMNRLESANFQSGSINWDDYEVDLSVIVPIHKNGSLKLITSGQKSADYVDRVRRFNYSEFYDTSDGGVFIEEIRIAWLDKFDYVFIDSRTGLTESGGVCTIHLPDILLLLFSPNEQSLKGVLNVADRSQTKRETLSFTRYELQLLFIPTRFDDLESSQKEEWLITINDEITPFVKWLPFSKEKNEFLFTIRQLINQIKIPYKAKYSYGERLVNLKDELEEPGSLGFTYETIGAIMVNEFGAIEELQNSRDLFIKKAKGEHVEDHSQLVKEIQQKKEEAIRLNEQLDLKEKQAKKQRRIRYRVFVALAVILFTAGVVVSVDALKKQTMEKDYNTFIATLAELSDRPDSVKHAELCKLAGYDNIYKDPRIESKKDSLRMFCAMQQRVDLSKMKVVQVADTVSAKSRNNKAFGQLDTLENKIQLTSNEIQNASNSNARLKFQSDSIQLELQKQKVINNDPILAKLAEPTAKLDSAIRQRDDISNQIIPVPKTDSFSVDYQKDGWFKQGYFLQFNNIRVSLTNLDVAAQTVFLEICATDGGACTIEIGKQELKVPGEFLFDFKGIKYRIKVNKIGRAGYNPFTQAAYITFVSFK